MRLAGHGAVAPIAAVAALLALVGAASSRPLGGGRSAPSLPLLPLLFVVGAGSVAAAALVWSLMRSRARVYAAPDDVSEIGAAIHAGPVMVALAALVPLTIVAIYVSVGTSGHHRTVAPPPVFSTHGAVESHRHGPADDATKGAAALAAGVAAGLVGLAAFVALRGRRRPRRGPFEPRAAVAAGARDAEAAIAIPADPRAAVLAAYARMEAALDKVGLARRASEAPREYLARLEAALRGGRAPAAALTALFERARFSDHPIGEEVRADALVALRRLRAELEAPA